MSAQAALGLMSTISIISISIARKNIAPNYRMPAICLKSLIGNWLWLYIAEGNGGARRRFGGHELANRPVRQVFLRHSLAGLPDGEKCVQ